VSFIWRADLSGNWLQLAPEGAGNRPNQVPGPASRQHEVSCTNAPQAPDPMLVARQKKVRAHAQRHCFECSATAPTNSPWLKT